MYQEHGPLADGLLDPELVPEPLVRADERPLTQEKSALQSRLGLGLRLLGLVLSLVWGFVLRRSQTEMARNARRRLERLGGLWVKLGQVLGMRRDVLPQAWCDEMSYLHDRVAGFPGIEARRVVDASLPLPIDEVFSRFDTEPIAAASIGQVHRARLRLEDVEVAVKVRRPGIKPLIERDLGVVAWLARWFVRFNILPQMRWPELVDGLREIMDEELDYRIEAAAGGRMRPILLNHGVYAPQIFYIY